ncbi:hypothetical protein B0A50_05316 [Salinomyces thailandicus]|uniref:GP-PDE domain-containing protein n=1 Tax=Salinomyces thailandicus TaxID=706561 RepID=A0A4V5N463_9PEZI|nr:hypothetical protein B0A50_05316 [Salinomyces thailandica]
MAHTRSDREPLLRRAPSALNVPPMLIQPGVEQLHSPTTVPEDAAFFQPTCTGPRLDERQRRMPQCIAHRGYKAKYPENTMAAFEGAVKAGAHAIETDVHITKDDVVVISHDETLKRVYGRQDKIIDLTWKEIEDVRTVEPPHERMPRLCDLLTWMAEPGNERIWCMLDIKLDNDAESIMRLIGKTLSEVEPAASRAWKERVVLGIWAAKYLPLAQKYLPGFPVLHIGFSTSYARHFFNVPNVGFNMLLPILIAPGGQSFLRDAREVYHRQVLTWTVNDEDRMEWCIQRQLNGVMTDDPVKFLDVCKKFDEKKKEAMLPLHWKSYIEIFRLWIWINFAAWLYRKKLEPVASKELITRRP